ncbi:MAG: hypothetical protein ABJH99_05545 [Tateyamaria sp.]
MLSRARKSDAYDYDLEVTGVERFQLGKDANWPDFPINETKAMHDESLAYQAKGQFLARQEDWDILATLISEADRDRTKTTQGVPIAELLAHGARADVVLSVEHALFDGRPAEGTNLLAGIEALEEVLADYPDSYPVAMIVALAHLDIGLAWRGDGWMSVLPSRNRDAFNTHCARAMGILDQFVYTDQTAPSLLATRCTLQAECCASQRQIADEFEKLVDADPANAGYMRAMGTHLLRQTSDSAALLDMEARRAAARTQEIWGAGAYTWICMEAVLMDDATCAQIEASLFIEGMRDILARSQDQHTANLLAAYCSVSIRAGYGSNDAADLVRYQLMKCADWIIRDHLTEIHPLVWARAGGRFDASDRAQAVQKLADRGRRDALDAISALFGDDFACGSGVAFAARQSMINVR